MPLVSMRAEWAAAQLRAIAREPPHIIKPTIGGGAWAPAGAQLLMRELAWVVLGERQPPRARPTPSLVLTVLDHTWTMKMAARMVNFVSLCVSLRSTDSSCAYEIPPNRTFTFNVTAL